MMMDRRKLLLGMGGAATGLMALPAVGGASRILLFAVEP